MFRLKTYQLYGIFLKGKKPCQQISMKGEMFRLNLQQKLLKVSGTFTHKNPDESYFDGYTTAEGPGLRENA